MPDRQYLPFTSLDPKDHWLAHPFQLVLSTWSIIFGLCMLFAAIFPDFNPAPTIDRLVWWVQVPLGVTTLLGGIGIHVAFWWPQTGENHLSGRRITLGQSWAIETMFLNVLAGGWFGYALTILSIEPIRVVQAGTPFAIGTGLVIRAWAVRVRADRIRCRIERVRKEMAQ